MNSDVIIAHNKNSSFYNVLSDFGTIFIEIDGRMEYFKSVKYGKVLKPIIS